MIKSIDTIRIRDSLKQLIKSGFFNIFGATIINSLVTFIYGIFLVKIMSQYDYGVFSYVQNITNFAVVFCSMGANLGVLQFCSEKVDDKIKYSYCRFAVVMGCVSSVIVTVVMIVYSFIDKSNIDSLTAYIAFFSLLPFLYFLKEWVTANLRWQLKNKEYGNVMNVHSITNALFAMLGAKLYGIYGVMIGIYMAYICSIILGMWYFRNDLPFVKKAQLPEKSKMFPFFKYSVTMCVVNAMISVLFTVDLFVIGNIVKDAESVAIYRTASVIPFALNMVPNSVMTFVYPHFAGHREDQEWLKKKTKLLYVANGALNVGIGVVLYIVAPVLIKVFFGVRYNDSIPIFRILILSYIVSSCLRTPSANLFGILRKTKTAFVISTCTVILSVCMSMVLVSRYGIVGAAYGSVCTFGTVGIVSLLILIYEIYRKAC